MSVESSERATPAVLLQHRTEAPGGALVDALAARGLDTLIVNVRRGESLPDPARIRLAIALGSADRIDDRAVGWANEEVRWLRRADRAGTPVLGVGFGAQLLAIALGGRIEHGGHPQRGWMRVSTTVPSLIAPGPWLAWHNDRIRLPAKARVLARGAVGPEAFRSGRHVGVQFLADLTLRGVHDLIDASEETLDVQGMLEATSRDFANSQAAAKRLFSAFIESATANEYACQQRSRRRVYA